MTTRFMEITVGLFVVMGGVALFVLAMNVSNFGSFSSKEGYYLTAYFENIGGLKVRSAITVSGVRIGQVSDIVFDPERLQAKVTLRVDEDHDYFTLDTSASIYTAGLLGEQYIALEPGLRFANAAMGKSSYGCFLDGCVRLFYGAKCSKLRFLAV